jgi:hypothetical protein
MINYHVFLYSLIFGILISYIFQKKKRIIYVYPTPENLDEIQYKDKTNTCFSFKMKNVKCPNNNLLEKYHIQ